MIKFFIRFSIISFILFTFSANAIPSEPFSKSYQPSNTEKIQLEKIISPLFQGFNPKIIDMKTEGTGINIIHIFVRAADHSDAFVIITPSNKVIDIDDYALLSNIDIKKDPAFSRLAEKTPNISIWPGNHDYPTFERLADGAQQLQFNYRLLNGCHACAVGGVATIGFNFDVKGEFINISLVKLSDPSISENNGNTEK